MTVCSVLCFDGKTNSLYRQVHHSGYYLITDLVIDFIGKEGFVASIEGH